MGWLDRWDVALLVAAGYVAVMALVRMMIRRRDQLVIDVRQQVEAHRRSKKRKKKTGGSQGRDAA